MEATQHALVKLHQRGLTPGSEFSIIICSVAVLAIFSCAIWSFLYTKYKLKRRFLKKRDNHNPIFASEAGQSFELPLTFPSNPAVRPLQHNSFPAHSPSLYNPRCESPFAKNPIPKTLLRTSVSTSDTVPGPKVVPNSSSDGLFSPKRVVASNHPQLLSNCHRRPRTDLNAARCTTSRDFGDAKDFILAVPEPLLLKPRTGDPHVVAKHQNTHDTPTSCSSDRILHPKKLFLNVSSGDNRISVCSSTSLNVDHRRSDFSSTPNAQEMMAIVDQAMKDGKKAFLASDTESQLEENPSDTHKPAIPTEEGSMTALHRLRSYKSLRKASCSTMNRAGTITRSKTPVEQIVRMYEGDDHKLSMPEINLPRQGSTFTARTSAVTPPVRTSMSTPPTSPGLRRVSLSMFPTRLRPKPPNVSPDISPSSTTKAGKLSTLRFRKSLETNRSFFDRSVHPNIQVRRRRRKRADKKALRATDGPRLKPLKLKSAIRRSISISDRSQRDSTGSFNTTIAPLPRRDPSPNILRASSLYSRDTGGFSMIRTPVSEGFPIPVFEVLGDTNTARPAVNLKKSRDSVKQRIDEWTKRIESAPSDFELRGHSQALGKRSLDEINGGKKGESGESSGDLADAGDPTNLESGAPGGAVWF